jgi:DegV family protein with EDD domain
MAIEPQCNLIIDTTCDLPFEMVNVPGVEIIQFPYIMGNRDQLDDMYQSITPKEFYDKIRHGECPTTAQVPITTFTDVFTRAAESGVPTVYLSFTSGLSGSYNTAVLVRDQVLAEHPDAELYIVDTLLASIAEALLVYEAIRQRNQGLTAKEMVAWAEEARYFVNELFTLDSLDSLKRGGRIPSSVAFAGSKLDVKPMLDITLDGKLGLTGVARGRKKAIRQMVEFYQKNAMDDGSSKMVLVGHADCQKDVDRLKDELRKVDDSIYFLDTNIGPVIGSHVGPGMLALVFWGHDSREVTTVSDRIARKVKSH